jgi:hypothetical protein
VVVVVVVVTEANEDRLSASIKTKYCRGAYLDALIVVNHHDILVT